MIAANGVVARFLGAANLIAGRMLGLAAAVAMVRPEHCRLGPAAAGSRWVWPGRVSEVTFLGSDVVADVACDNGLSLRVRARAVDPPRPDHRVEVGIPEGHAWAIPEPDPRDESAAAP